MRQNCVKEAERQRADDEKRREAEKVERFHKAQRRWWTAFFISFGLMVLLMIVFHTTERAVVEGNTTMARVFVLSTILALADAAIMPIMLAATKPLATPKVSKRLLIWLSIGVGFIYIFAFPSLITG